MLEYFGGSLVYARSRIGRKVSLPSVDFFGPVMKQSWWGFLRSTCW